VENPELCPRFSVRVFTDVTVGPSPLWLKARLVAAGQRPINNVVDITNYVMLLLGQPMHAYDLDKVAGPSLVVRLAREGERLTTLDGEERCFDGDAMLICDARGPTGIGGIMGGGASEVSESTTRVAMEAATWNGPNILRTSSKLGLRTEASARFEKQLDPELALRAQRLTSRLMVELCGARLAPGEVDVAAEPPPQRPIRLRSEHVEGLLGVAVDPADSKEILGRLGFEVEERDGDLEVVPPYFRRQDVTREADVIEEVARIHGLDKIPATLPARDRAIGRLTQDQAQRRRIEDLLRDRGLSEVITYSFIAPDSADRLRLSEAAGRRRALHLSNPLSEEMSAMRLMLLPGLLETARRNLAHDLVELRIFETGRVFFSNGPDRLPEERQRLAVLLAGLYRPRTWRSPPMEPDFYVIKGLLQAVLETLRVDWRLAGGGPPFLHPGRAADVLVAGHEAGGVGEVHPLVARNFGLEDLERPPAVFELDLDVVLAAAGRTPTYVDLITYPAVFQDIAVVVDEAVEAQTVIECVRMGGGRHLRNVTVFDLYRGEQVGEGRKSIALRLEFRAPDRTLTDEEVATQRAEIRDGLARELGASLRE
jgi:phenylalanyl-tRNA synthetase beta chain